MSMQVWTLAKVAGPLLVIVGVQTLLAAIYTLLVVFSALGKDYQAAVLSAGFIGISLGSTPTAIAAMTAVINTTDRRPMLSLFCHWHQLCLSVSSMSPRLRCSYLYRLGGMDSATGDDRGVARALMSALGGKADMPFCTAHVRF